MEKQLLQLRFRLGDEETEKWEGSNEALTEWLRNLQFAGMEVHSASSSTEVESTVLCISEAFFFLSFLCFQWRFMKEMKRETASVSKRLKMVRQVREGLPLQSKTRCLSACAEKWRRGFYISEVNGFALEDLKGKVKGVKDLLSCIVGSFFDVVGMGRIGKYSVVEGE